MKIYHYDDLGIFTHSSDARVSPLEPEVYLIPAKATTEVPMAPVVGKARVFTAGAWTLITDARGRYYNQARQEVYITELGVDLPEGLTVEPRPLTQAELDAIATQEARLADIEAAKTTAALKQYTVAQATNWIIDKLTNAPNTIVGVKQAVGEILIRMLPYILPK